jgi:hypothetical protein
LAALGQIALKEGYGSGGMRVVFATMEGEGGARLVGGAVRRHEDGNAVDGRCWVRLLAEDL